MIITIDGPSASGKSTLARTLAQEYQALYVDSGMLFRAVGYILMNHCGYNLEQLADVDQTRVRDCTNPDKLQYLYKDSQIRLLWRGQDITSSLKSPEIDRAASLLGANPQVREGILTYIHILSHGHDVVADGRDMGTVVFPHAEHKFYVTAMLAERARRWRIFQKNRGNSYTQEEAEQEIAERDQRDETRAIAPLRKPIDAQEIDTTMLTPEQTLQRVQQLLQGSD